MHEGSITTQIVESVLKEAKNRNAKRVVQVDLQIGALTFLNPEQVSFWYELLIKDTILEGSRLVIETRKGVVYCSNCNYKDDFKYTNASTLHLQVPSMQCPRCNGLVEIVEGRDCIVRSIKLLV